MAFIDKINPDVPEGRLLIRNGEYVLKDPEDVSTQSRYKKFSFLFNYKVNIILIFFLFRRLLLSYN